MSIPALAQQPVQARIAVAANFSSTMNQLLASFNTSTHRVYPSYGSSGKLYAQILNGAPYHGFLSADQERVDRLIQSKQAVAQSGFIYAEGLLVLWAHDAKYFPVQSNSLGIHNHPIRLSFANPKLAPYGQAASVYLQRSAQDQLGFSAIKGESVSQAFQFVASGNADFGLVSKAQVISTQQPDASWWAVPGNLYPPIKQKAVLTEKGRNNAAAQAFFQFLKSDKAINIIQQNGYSVDVSLHR